MTNRQSATAVNDFRSAKYTPVGAHHILLAGTQYKRSSLAHAAQLLLNYLRMFIVAGWSA